VGSYFSVFYYDMLPPLLEKHGLKLAEVLANDLPADVRDGILRGLYLVRPSGRGVAKVRLLGSGTILREVREAAKILREDYNVGADVWSVTSFNELRREGLAVEGVGDGDIVDRRALDLALRQSSPSGRRQVDRRRLLPCFGDGGGEQRGEGGGERKDRTIHAESSGTDGLRCRSTDPKTRRPMIHPGAADAAHSR
jgi:hypothetical protein